MGHKEWLCRARIVKHLKTTQNVHQDYVTLCLNLLHAVCARFSSESRLQKPVIKLMEWHLSASLDCRIWSYFLSSLGQSWFPKFFILGNTCQNTAINNI